MLNSDFFAHWQTNMSEIDPVKIICWCGFAADRIEAAVRPHKQLMLQRVETLDAFRDHVMDADGALMIGVDGHYDQAVAEVVRNAPSRFRWIQNMTAGYDGLSKHGVSPSITVTLSRGSNAISVAEHGFALLLASIRAIPDIARNQSKLRWSHEVLPRLSSLEGRMLCVVGAGAIGVEFARLAKAFRMQTTGIVRRYHPCEHMDFIVETKDRLAAIRSADVLCIAAPLTDETYRLVGRAELEALGSKGYLVNIGRGPIVDSAELNIALREGVIAGAALDVTDPEPLPQSNPLWTAPNLLISPHVAGYGSERSFERLVELVVDNMLRFSKGCALLHPWERDAPAKSLTKGASLSGDSV
jgi:phosphoglycerate dehydrogenase-like enzyme